MYCSQEVNKPVSIELLEVSVALYYPVIMNEQAIAILATTYRPVNKQVLSMKTVVDSMSTASRFANLCVHY